GLENKVYAGNFVVGRSLALHGISGSILDARHAGSVLAIDADRVTIADLELVHSGRRATTEDAGVRARGEAVHLDHLRVRDSLFGISLHECHHCVISAAHIVGDTEPSPLQGDGIKLWEAHDSSVLDSL